MLGYTNAHKVSRRKHLVKKLFPWLIFFLLISISRVMNNKYFFRHQTREFSAMVSQTLFIYSSTRAWGNCSNLYQAVTTWKDRLSSLSRVFVRQFPLSRCPIRKYNWGWWSHINTKYVSMRLRHQLYRRKYILTGKLKGHECHERKHGKSIFTTLKSKS